MHERCSVWSFRICFICLFLPQSQWRAERTPRRAGLEACMLFSWQVSAFARETNAVSQIVSARLVDSSGAPSSAGLLQVQTGDGSFGTVCGLGLAAVDVVCRQLGTTLSICSRLALACSHTCSGACVYDFACACACMCACVIMCMCVQVFVFLFIVVCVFVCVCVDECVCVCV